MAEKQGNTGIDVEKLLVLYSVCDLQLGKEIGSDAVIGETTLRTTPDYNRDRQFTSSTSSVGSSGVISCPECPPTPLFKCITNSTPQNASPSIAAILSIIISLI